MSTTIKIILCSSLIGVGIFSQKMYLSGLPPLFGFLMTLVLVSLLCFCLFIIYCEPLVKLKWRQIFILILIVVSSVFLTDWTQKNLSQGTPRRYYLQRAL